jgi:hypothetical protein
MARTRVLRDVDGLVFVADCQWERLGENLERFRNPRETPRGTSTIWASFHGIQYNRRDVSTIAPVEYLEYLFTRRQASRSTTRRQAGAWGSWPDRVRGAPRPHR